MRSSRAPLENGGSADSDDFGSGKTFGLFGALVDRRKADLGEPDRLGPRRPCGRGRARRRRRARHAGSTTSPQILGAEDPGLAIGAVGDRRAGLRAPVGVVGVVPVEALAAARLPAQIVEVVDAARRARSAWSEPVAPVGERRVISRCRPRRSPRCAQSGSSGKRTSPPPSRTCAPYSVQSAP